MDIKLPLTLVIITLNEERHIARCIQSVPFAQEVIVVDSLSQDQTRQIAKEHGAHVIEQKFLGYREQKQFALDKAKTPWVLSLDGDEALSPALQEEIKALLLNPDLKASAYRMPRCSFHLNRWIKHGGWYPDYQTRLLKRGKAKWVGGEVHESIKVDGPVGTLKNDLLHWVFTGLDDQIETNNEFSTLGARDLIKRGKRFSLLKLLFKPVSKFIECYLWKLGFLDGVAGFIIALGASQSVFLKYAKIWELTRGSK